MVTIFDKPEDRDPLFARYRAEWENGLLAAALAANAEPAARRKLLQRFYNTRFNAASFDAAEPGDGPWAGELDLIQAGPTQLDIVYRAPYGLVCPLARIYEQPNGSWASLIIAGVPDLTDRYEALAAAEWAIAQLTA